MDSGSGYRGSGEREQQFHGLSRELTHPYDELWVGPRGSGSRAMGVQRGPPGTDLSSGPRAGSSQELLKKGIRWGAAGLWEYHKRESAGERRGCGNTTKGNPLGSGGGEH